MTNSAVRWIYNLARYSVQVQQNDCSTYQRRNWSKLIFSSLSSYYIIKDTPNSKRFCPKWTRWTTKDALSHRAADFNADKSGLQNFIINFSVPFQILSYLAGNIEGTFWNQNNVLLNRLKIIESIKKRNCNPCE